MINGILGKTDDDFDGMECFVKKWNSLFEEIMYKNIKSNKVLSEEEFFLYRMTNPDTVVVMNDEETEQSFRERYTGGGTSGRTF